MKKEYWLNKWQSKDIAFHEQGINPDLIAYIGTLNLKKGDTIFVPLCGKSNDLYWLAEQGFQVIGSELSSIACDEFFSERQITPTVIEQDSFVKYQYENIELVCGDFFALNTIKLPAIKAIYDCKALIALPPELRGQYIQQIITCFGRNIKILLLTRESNCKITPPPFPIDKTEIDLLYSSCFNVEQLKCENITNIPENLRKKGYTEMRESVYLISFRID